MVENKVTDKEIVSAGVERKGCCVNYACESREMPNGDEMQNRHSAA